MPYTQTRLSQVVLEGKPSFANNYILHCSSGGKLATNHRLGFLAGTKSGITLITNILHF